MSGAIRSSRILPVSHAASTILRWAALACQTQRLRAFACSGRPRLGLGVSAPQSKLSTRSSYEPPRVGKAYPARPWPALDTDATPLPAGRGLGPLLLS